MSARLCVSATALPAVKTIVRTPLQDSRGVFQRVYCAQDLQGQDIAFRVAQINESTTRRTGTIRGLHFQHPPQADGKIVSCMRGRVFDVAVDLRRGSATFLKWHGEILSDDNHRSLYIPAGFAHGFQTLVDDCTLLYLHDMPYIAAAEGGLHANDPRLAIAWPLPVGDMSERDRGQRMIAADYAGMTL